MNLKPLNNLDEHDTVNFFAYADPTGSKGTPIVIAGSGWNNSQNQTITNGALLGNPANVNIYSPRWANPARIRAAVSGEKPFGIMLYDVKEVNQYNYPLVYDKQRRDEAQCVVSGQTVPFTRKGLLLVGPFATGVTPYPGKYAIVTGSGLWGVGTTGVGGTIPSGAFGEFLGSKDADGYAAVMVNCYL